MTIGQNSNVVDWELQIIGAILKDENADDERFDIWGDLKRYQVKKEYFSDPNCRMIFDVFEKLKSEDPAAPLAITRVAENLSDKITQLDLIEYQQGTLSVRNVKDYFLFKFVEHNISQSKIKSVLESIIQQIDSGKKPDLDLADTLIQRCKIDMARIKALPTVSLGEYLENKREIDKNRESGKLLGFGSNKFLNLCKDIDGIQPGFYIIGAETNIGKTALLTNLFLDIIETNPHSKGIYYSLDDSKDVIINRMLSIKTGLPINQVQRKQDNETDEHKLSGAYSELKKLAESDRINIKDQAEINHVDSLEIDIRERADGNFFVVIDGLYNLEVGSDRTGGLREVNIDRANRIKALVDTYRIPIIVTGELRKRSKDESSKKSPQIDDLMETGKFAYNANLVWLIYPEDRDDFEKSDEAILLVKFAKNKLSHFKDFRKLRFIRAKGIIKEEHYEIPKYK